MRPIRASLLLMAGFVTGVVWVTRQFYKFVKAIDSEITNTVRDSLVDTAADMLRSEPARPSWSRRRSYADYSRPRSVFDPQPEADQPKPRIRPIQNKTAVPGQNVYSWYCEKCGNRSQDYVLEEVRNQSMAKHAELVDCNERDHAPT